MGRGTPLSEDIRESIIDAHKKGFSARKISATHSVPRTTVQDIIKLYEKTGFVVVQGKKTGRPSTISASDSKALKKIIKATTNVGASIREITKQWREVVHKEMSVSTTKREIRKLGYKFRKNKKKAIITKEDLTNEPEIIGPNDNIIGHTVA